MGPKVLVIENESDIKWIPDAAIPAPGGVIDKLMTWLRRIALVRKTLGLTGQ